MPNKSAHTITAVANGGHGICRIEGQVCFVPYALPGDVVTVTITRKTKGVLWGKIDQLIEPGPDRTTPSCTCFEKCGGCAWLHFAYPAQMEWKQRIVRDCLERMAGIEADIGWAEDASLRVGYRTRAEFHLDKGRVGFYEPSSHNIVDIERCPLCHENLNAALQRLRTLKPRDTAIEIVVNPEGPEVMLWTQHPQPKLEPHFTAVNWPSRRKFPSQFMFDGTPIVNGAFSQSSLLLNRVLKNVVHTALGTPASLLDLYCGNGNFSLTLPESTSVLGLDHAAPAVHAASQLRPKAYRVGDERTFMEALAQDWDAIVLDPPRLGAKPIAEALGKAKTNKIVYVSCDPATLARDLKVIAAQGWTVNKVTAVDIFPNTPHIETVCCLTRV